MDLERELRALPVDWPPTPQLRTAPGRRRKRWLLAVAVAAAAVATSFAVPASRGAILRFFDLGAVRVRLVDTLPSAQERPLAAGLGAPATLSDARAAVPDLLLPRLDPLPQLRRSGELVSLLFLYRSRPVLLSELVGDGVILKKIAAVRGGRFVQVRGRDAGLWLGGAKHLVLFPHEPARLAGNTLVWQGDRTTYRLEAPGLSLAHALALADALTDTP